MLDSQIFNFRLSIMRLRMEMLFGFWTFDMTHMSSDPQNSNFYIFLPDTHYIAF